jgi:type I restriction enzyme R subunit
MQQAITYGEQLDVPSVFTTNGDSFVWHDRTGLRDQVEEIIPLDKFPGPEELYAIYQAWRGIAPDVEPIVRFISNVAFAQPTKPSPNPVDLKRES